MWREVVCIAEVKTESPFGYRSDKNWEELFRIAESVGDVVSIHTNPRWGGSFELLEKARSMTSKPILAKGLHETDAEVERAVALGADWVLVVGRIPKVHLGKCMIEPNTLEELKIIPENLRVVWNSRNLANGGFKTEAFQEAREIFKGWLCQASNIEAVADIEPGANAVLIGTNLEEFIQSLPTAS